jgi:hypothetical protein
MTSTGSVQYRTSDVRFVQERPYRVRKAVLYATGTGLVEIKLKAVEQAATNNSPQGTSAASGLIKLGTIPARVRVTSTPQADWVTPFQDTLTLVEITTVLGNCVGVLKVVLDLGNEVFPTPTNRILEIEDSGDDAFTHVEK